MEKYLLHWKRKGYDSIEDKLSQNFLHLGTAHFSSFLYNGDSGKLFLSS